MSHVFSTIALLALVLPSVTLAEWYAIQRKPTTTLRIQENGKSIRVPVRKLALQVTDLVLRPDTEDAKRYWVEATLVQWRDSGDGYLLAFGDVVLGEIYTRGNKWAIGFTSLDEARRCFQHLRKLHKLDADHARDTTNAYHHFTPQPIAMGTSIAEQGAAGQPLGFPSASHVLSNSNLNPASDLRRHPSGASA